jgi:type 1 fimbria pilin
MVDNIYITNNGPDMANSGSIYIPPNEVGSNAINYSYVLKSGSTMTGPLHLNADPTYSDEAATKNYVDNAVSNASSNSNVTSVAFKIQSLYRTSSLLFDGNSSVYISNLNANDTNFYTFSAWYQQFEDLTNSTSNVLFTSGPTGTEQYGEDAMDLNFLALAPPEEGWTAYAGNYSGYLDSYIQMDNAGSFQGNSGVWHHVFLAADLTGMHNLKIYVDGVDETQSISGGGSTATININGNKFQVGSDDFGNNFNGLLAEVWFDTSSFFEEDGTISPYTLSLFRDPTLNIPVYLGPDGSYPSGLQPAVYLRCENCNLGTFLLNLGYGGNFVSSGSLETRNGPTSF